MKPELCPLCQTPVKIVGDLTRHYEPMHDVNVLLEQLEIAMSVLNTIGSECACGWEETGKCNPTCLPCQSVLALKKIERLTSKGKK